VAVVRVIAALRRTPYVVRAADYWTEAAELIVSSSLIIGALRRLEAWGLRGAKILFAAHDPLIARFREVGIATRAVPIGFGADTKDFHYGGQEPPQPPVFVYAGTYAEWHGAEIFIEALADVVKEHPGARLVYYGNGENRDGMRSRARELGIEGSIDLNGPIPPAELSPIIAAATASVASLAPVAPNEYAVATKAYSSLASGCPVIFAGVGPTAELLSDSGHPLAGVAVGYDVGAVTVAMNAAADAPLTSDARAELAAWSSREFSLAAIASTVVDESLAIIGVRTA
jgi:glycosyltransferase involved in cell wall biosynthesis